MRPDYRCDSASSTFLPIGLLSFPQSSSLLRLVLPSLQQASLCFARCENQVGWESCHCVAKLLGPTHSLRQSVCGLGFLKGLGMVVALFAARDSPRCYRDRRVSFSAPRFTWNLPSSRFNQMVPLALRQWLVLFFLCLVCAGVPLLLEPLDTIAFLGFAGSGSVGDRLFGAASWNRCDVFDCKTDRIARWSTPRFC